MIQLSSIMNHKNNRTIENIHIYNQCVDALHDANQIKYYFFSFYFLAVEGQAAAREEQHQAQAHPQRVPPVRALLSQPKKTSFFHILIY